MAVHRNAATGRRSLSLCVAVLVAFGAPAAAQSNSHASAQTFMLVRTAAADRPTDWHLGLGWVQPVQGFVGAMGVRVQSHRAVGGGVTFFSTIGTGDDVEVVAAGERVSPCHDEGACAADFTTLGATYGEDYYDSGDATEENRFFVVVDTTRPASVTFRANGWTLRHVGFGYRWLDSDQADAPQVRAADSGVEVFTSGSLPGGRWGSAASVTPPCSGESESALPQGAGRLTLSAPGVTPQSAVCPTSPWATTAVTGRATTWTAQGASVGVNGGDTARMFVVDLPRRL